MGCSELCVRNVPGEAVDGRSEGCARLSHQLHASVCGPCVCVCMYVCMYVIHLLGLQIYVFVGSYESKSNARTQNIRQ